MSCTTLEDEHLPLFGILKPNGHWPLFGDLKLGGTHQASSRNLLKDGVSLLAGERTLVVRMGVENW